MTDLDDLLSKFLRKYMRTDVDYSDKVEAEKKFKQAILQNYILKSEVEKTIGEVPVPNSKSKDYQVGYVDGAVKLATELREKLGLV